MTLSTKLFFCCSKFGYLLYSSLIVKDHRKFLSDKFLFFEALHRNFFLSFFFYLKDWWAYLDLNQRPRPYQGRALTN